MAAWICQDGCLRQRRVRNDRFVRLNREVSRLYSQSVPSINFRLIREFIMPPCCRCNGSGRCKNCVCHKSGRSCTDCLPSHRGNCSNGHIPAPPSLTTPSKPSTPPTVAPGPVPGPEQWDRADSPSLDGSSDLPQFAEISHPNFRWGRVDGTTFINLIDKAYDEIVHVLETKLV